MHVHFSNPETGKGFLAYAVLGFSGAVVALLIGAIFPSLIPAQATRVNL